MALSKSRMSKKSRVFRMRLAGTMLAMTITLSGCVQISSYESTAEYIPAAQVAGQASAMTYTTAQVYEDDFVVEYQTQACVTYTVSCSLYWENAQDFYGELLVSDGDIVKKGDVLATFVSSEDYEIELKEKSLAVEEAKTSLSQIQKTYEDLIAAKEKSMMNLTGDE